MRRFVTSLLVLVLLAVLGWAVARRLASDAERAPRAAVRAPAPVEVAPVERGAIALRRTLSGALEPAAEFVVAPKVAGRLVRVEVDLGDAVQRGQVVAVLDDDELRQDLRRAEAELAVAQADVSEAASALEIAQRALERFATLQAEGASSEAQLDAARSEHLAAQAEVAVSDANLERAAAALESARIRLGYAQVTADWRGADEVRVVAQRFFDEGETVSSGASLLSIVQLDPLTAVVHVPERDYATLAVGQTARLATDAHPGREFGGRVARIAPVFRQATRQARVELSVPNAEGALKPGMFVRATLELARVADALVVPYAALCERAGQPGVFALDADGEHVRWVAVEAGIREGERLELVGAALTGNVVVLGQELCDDGARVNVVAPPSEEPPAR